MDLGRRGGSTFIPPHSLSSQVRWSALQSSKNFALVFSGLKELDAERRKAMPRGGSAQWQSIGCWSEIYLFSCWYLDEGECFMGPNVDVTWSQHEKIIWRGRGMPAKGLSRTEASNQQEEKWAPMKRVIQGGFQLECPWGIWTSVQNRKS